MAPGAQQRMRAWTVDGAIARAIARRRRRLDLSAHGPMYSFVSALRSVHTRVGSLARRHRLASPFRTTAPARHCQQQGEQCGEDSTNGSHERHERHERVRTRGNEGRPQEYRRARIDPVGAFLILRRLKSYTRVRDPRSATGAERSPQPGADPDQTSPWPHDASRARCTAGSVLPSRPRD